MTQDFDRQRKRNTAILAGVVVFAIAAGLLAGVGGFGGLRLIGYAPNYKGLAAHGAIGTPGFQKLGSVSPGILQKVAQQPVMPADVEGWLKHLEETERRKRILTQRQETELKSLESVMGLGVTSAQDVKDMTDPDMVLDKTPANNKLQEVVGRMKADWYRLNDYFVSKVPPAECQTIASNYSTGLSQLGDSMADIAAIVDSLNPMSADLNNDIEAKKKDVYQIQQGHRQTVDESFKKSLFGVDEVCHKYNKARWFDIDTSGGGSNVLGKYMGG